MKNQIVFPPAADTETLLQGLIAELHAIIRDDIRPAIAASESSPEKRHLMHSAMQLLEAGAKVGDAIGRLRHGAAHEMRQRITVERIAAIPHAEGEG